MQEYERLRSGLGTTYDKEKRLRFAPCRKERCHGGGRGSRINDEIGAKCCMKILQPRKPGMVKRKLVQSPENVMRQWRPNCVKKLRLMALRAR